MMVRLRRAPCAGLAALTLGVVLAATAGGQPSIAADTVTIHSGELVLRGLLWRPTGAGPFPAVLFNHGSGPAEDLSRAAILGRTFTRRGYVFLYLFRRGAGLSADQGTNSTALMSQALMAGGQRARSREQLRLLEEELHDVIAGLAYLRASAEVDSQRVAVSGHSFGGQLSLLLAERDTTVGAVVVFGAAAASWEGSPELRKRLLTSVDHIKAPVFFIHAANDFSVVPGKALAAEMTRRGKTNRLGIYPAVGKTTAAGHDFVYSSVWVWEPDVFGFLDANLAIR